MNKSALEESIGNISSQFIIKYSEREIQKIRRPERNVRNEEPKRYSSRQETQKIKDTKYLYRVSESMMDKVKANKSVGLPSYLKPTEASISAQLVKSRAASNTQLMEQKKK